MNKSHYPTDLNPFGDDESIDEEYPDHLDPFGEDKIQDPNPKLASYIEEYDDSLNPFGDDDGNNDRATPQKQPSSQIDESICQSQASVNQSVDSLGDKKDPQVLVYVEPDGSKDIDKAANSVVNVPNEISSQPQSLECSEPPKPLPRTKSLLKKEALRRRQQEQHNQELSTTTEVSNNRDCRPPSIGTCKSCESSTAQAGSLGSFKRNKNKRAAPPVPVNFKRQVSGSLEAIEDELNNIGDQLALIEKESISCRDKLKAPDANARSDFHATRSTFVNLIKKKNSIVRRQKELMYKKRELKLDQIHSDIEYELRMIGNKQLSTKTPEDESREKDLLKKLVEIVEEKNDIIENLNKDTSDDNQEINEALERLNISESSNQNEDGINSNSASLQSSPRTASKNEHCDKISFNRLSKIATLLPKGNTIKGTIKIKRKRLFKKNHDSQLPT